MWLAPMLAERANLISLNLHAHSLFTIFFHWDFYRAFDFFDVIFPRPRVRSLFQGMETSHYCLHIILCSNDHCFVLLFSLIVLRYRDWINESETGWTSRERTPSSSKLQAVQVHFKLLYLLYALVLEKSVATVYTTMSCHVVFS